MNQLKSFLIIDCHRIEKGLSLKEIKPNFGQESKVLERIYFMSDIYTRKFSSQDKTIMMVYHCLKEYKEWHLENKIKMIIKIFVFTWINREKI